MKYIIIHDDAMPGLLKDASFHIDGMRIEEILEEVRQTLLFQESCIKDPSKVEELYGDGE